MACRKLHVLLVEHEREDHDTIMNMLQYLSYKVTSAELASTAISILSKGKKARFDLVIANINSPDSLGFQLLQDATKMDLHVVFMSNVDDALTSIRALEQGAFLCVTKPMTIGMLRFLKQFVSSEKSRRLNKTEACRERIDLASQENQISKYVILESNQLQDNININIVNLQEKPQKANPKGSVPCRSSALKRKGWTEWTVELHGKFMAAARQLGQGRCYPKDVLELMNVPGLTRMQVASHLQKCRNANWLAPNERKRTKAPKSETTPRKLRKAPRSKTSRFGLMPFPDNEDEYSSQFNQTFQEYHAILNHQEFTINPPTGTSYHTESSNSNRQECFTIDPPIQTIGYAESWNSNLQELTINPYPPIQTIDHAESWSSNHQEFTHNPPPQTIDHAESSNPNNLLFDHGFYPNPFGLNQKASDVGLVDQFVYGNIITEDPFELVPVMDSSTLHNYYDFQQELDMGFNESWPSFMPYGEELNQVGALANTTNVWFHEAVTPELEKEGTNQQGEMKEGK